MVSSRVSYSAMQYEIAHRSDRFLAPMQEFSRLRIDTREPNMPVLYVAMATWIPKCNMYQYNSQPEAEKIDLVEISDDEVKKGTSKGGMLKYVEVIKKQKEILDKEKANSTKKEQKLEDTHDQISDETEQLIEENSETKHKKVDAENENIGNATQKQIENDLDEIEQMDIDINEKAECSILEESFSSTSSSKLLNKTSELEITPKKNLTPKQLKKKMESEKKKQEKQKEKEEREKKKQEKDRIKQEKLKQKQEKDEQKRKEQEAKQKEKELKEEQKRKEREEKEQKRKEKEEKEEAKRKEREAEKLKKQQEIDEKNKEKQKQEEQMMKSKAVFANFFLQKKQTDLEEKKVESSKDLAFMPFEVKSDMRLAPIVRRKITESEKSALDAVMEEQKCEKSEYLQEIKRCFGKYGKTWPLDDTTDDVMIVDDNLGESIEEEKTVSSKMRAKFLKFSENQRPPYYGTWRKKSKTIKPTTPFVMDSELLNYEVDSDEEWEEEDPGESLKGSDDEEKEVDSENEYEVDNEFFVPHGHLSEDELDDEEDAKLSPESHKAKLKLLKNEFDEEHKTKTQKIKPRLIGCVWYDKERMIDEAITAYLKPFAVLCNGEVKITNRSEAFSTSVRQKDTNLKKDLVPDFLTIIHGNKNKRKFIVNEFIEYLASKDLRLNITKANLMKQLKHYAQWMRCPDKGIENNKYCWYVSEAIRKEYNLDLNLPNQWKYITKDLNETN